jgi:hypothetical protein
MEGIVGTVEFLESLLTTLLTPIIYRNWLYKSDYCTYPQVAQWK